MFTGVVLLYVKRVFMSLCKLAINLVPFVATRPFYSPRSNSYIKTHDPTSGLKWLAPYTITRVLLSRCSKWWLLWCGECSILSNRTTIIVTTRGCQQHVVVSSCTVAACWHATPALPATAALCQTRAPLISHCNIVIRVCIGNTWA
jgi:hypothetical protein